MIKHILFCMSVILCGASSFAQDIGLPKDTTVAYTIGLDEVKVMASYGNPKGEEPVMLSTISAKDIQLKISNLEFPQIMRAAPSIYASRQGGGFGDSRLTLRGFGSENIALLINGIPVNGMENGAIYWSNWSGLSNVTNSIQVQRGIGLSKLGLFSVGGTVNIITIGTEYERKMSLFGAVGNDGFLSTGFNFSSGMLPGDWAFTVMGARESSKGYIPGTNYEAWNYFGSVSKRFGTTHILSLTAFGAPQWHNRRSNKHFIEDYEKSPYGIKMNDSYGYLAGNVVPTYSGYNKYHKPQISLNHYWTISDKSSLYTSVYMSNAKGGGRKVIGDNANKLQYNYKDGRPYPGVTSLTPDGLIDYVPVMEANRTSATGSKAIFTMGTNAHDWYGLISSFTSDLTDHWRITAGIDGRYYIGDHFDEITDLLGGSYYKNNTKDNNLAWRDPNTELKVGDKVSQDYFSRILWIGGFAQLEYNRENYKAFLSASVNHHGYKREDPGKYGPYSNQNVFPESMRKTKWSDFTPVSIKAGFNYRITKEHNVFINGGYVTRPPMMDNIYVDNKPLSKPTMESIVTAEIGYGFHARKVDVTLSAYYTKWMDKSVTKFPDFGSGAKSVIPNIDALHKGIELEAEYRPWNTLRLAGYLTIGDWKWTNDVHYVVFDQANNTQGEYNAYVKGLHVGNAPQTTAMLSVSWIPVRRLEVGTDWYYNARYYADFNPQDRKEPGNHQDAWKLPSWSTFDLYASYDFNIGDVKARVIANVNNVFDTKYISDAVDGKDHNRETALVWYGFGTTWTTGLQLVF